MIGASPRVTSALPPESRAVVEVVASHYAAGDAVSAVVEVGHPVHDRAVLDDQHRRGRLDDLVVLALHEPAPRRAESRVHVAQIGVVAVLHRVEGSRPVLVVHDLRAGSGGLHVVHEVSRHVVPVVRLRAEPVPGRSGLPKMQDFLPELFGDVAVVAGVVVNGHHDHRRGQPLGAPAASQRGFQHPVEVRPVVDVLRVEGRLRAHPDFVVWADALVEEFRPLIMEEGVEKP